MSTLLTIKDAANKLAVSTKTIYRWISERKIVHIKLPGGDIRFREEWLDNWIENKTVKAKSK